MIHAPQEAVRAAPTAPSERIALIDVLRGFALLGIFTVNIALFSHPIEYTTLTIEHANGLDAAIAWLTRVLAEGKFYSLFSMLFGLGFAMQLARAQQRGGSIVPVYLRRNFILLIIGVLHGLLLWVGDILVPYAVGSLVLLLARKAKDRTLLIWAAILLILPTLFLVAALGMMTLARMSPEGATEIDAVFTAQAAITQAELDQAYAVYGSGNFAEITAQRWHDLLKMWGLTLFIFPNILAMFLVGAVVGRRGLLRDSAAHRALFRRVLIWGGSIGLLLNIVYATGIANQDRTIPTWSLVVVTLAQAIGAPLLAAAYAAGIALLWQDPDWQRRLRGLAPAGRMALTNYLLQSVIATTIFYGYGFALFGQVGATLGLAIVFAIYALQVAWSPWWLARYRFGPMEWLWRSLTYWRFQPMRLDRTTDSESRP